MSAVTAIVLADALVTPVNHTFIPLGPDANNVWWFEDQSGASAIGYNRLSVAVKRNSTPSSGTNSGTRVNRIQLGIHTPKLETLGVADAGITPPPTVAYVPRASVEFVISERSSLQDRKDLRKYIQFLCADAQVVAAVELLQPIY